MKKILLVCTLISNLILAQTQTIFDINNISLPLDNKGNLGYIYLPPSVHGTFDSITFIFCGGFWLSGFNNDSLWANGVASVSYLENYLPGNVDSSQYDPRYDLYVNHNYPYTVNYLEWNRYKFAVRNGADYYDGDGNGVYDPIDLNGNNRWEPNEDRPDIIGDKTAWCVYNDGEVNRIIFEGVEPQGIEIHQSVFGFSPYSAPQLQNVVFIKNKIINTGKVNSILDSVYFSAWADPDLGQNFTDDLVGCDTILNSGFIYNKQLTDPGFGAESPSFFITLLQGPQSYIPGETFIDINSNGIYDDGVDTPLDSAYNRKGNELGIELFPGAKNMSMTSFTHYIGSDPANGGPNNEYQARNYMTGKFPNGDAFDPCAQNYWGGVFGGVDCNLVNPLYWYSGDPVNHIGWLDTLGTDQRTVINSGPFNLEVGKPITIIYAYIIGRGSDRLNSITKAREIAAFTHQFYQSNFDDNLVSVEDEVANIPTEFILYQNYPNPFNPITTIKYSIPNVISTEGRNLNVTLKVYDVLGNEVATLVNEFRNAGSYEVNFNASSLSSGIYFYQLQVGSFIQSKKMILIK